MKGHHFHAVSGQGIYSLLYGDKANAQRRIHYLRQPAHFHLLTPEAGEVFHDDCADFSVLCHTLHTHKIWSLEGCTRYAVVHEKHGVGVSLFSGVVLQNLFLVGDGVRLLVLVVIIHG